jgi:hypothetical protein
MKRTSIVVCIAGAALLGVGCGSKAAITGTVTYQGKPIPAGYIVFTPESGAPAVNAPINDGKYTAEKVPTGPAKVTVTSLYMEDKASNLKANRMGAGTMPAEAMAKMGAPPKDAPIPEEARERMSRGAASFTQSKKGLKIPDKYGDPAKSGLTYTVQPGSQSKDFNLE